MSSNTMRAAHFGGGNAISIVDRPMPVPGPGQLLLRVGANALCGSERGQFRNGSPVVPGHEAAGMVVAAGPNTSTAVGTAGVVFLMVFCGECRNCRRGATNQCLHKRGDMGFNRDGGYAEYQLVDESSFFAAAGFGATDATLLLDIMGTGGHAIERGRRVHDDIRSVLVAGAGPIGLGVLAMAKIILRDLPVYVTDVSPYRLALAEKMGGLPVDVANASLSDGLSRHGVSHVDLAIDTSGKGAARQAAIDALDKRGAFVCVGHGEGLNLDVSRQLIAPEHAVLGSEYFCFDELPANVERLRVHKEYIAQIITHRMPLAEIQHAFELFFGGATGKVVIEP
jgi:threonine dehydrogenase-like Zn-dependent dehydrogenase